MEQQSSKDPKNYIEGLEYIEPPIQYEPIYYEENGSTLVYQHDYQSIPHEIYHEEVVGDEHEEYLESLPSTSTAPPPPPPTNKHRLIRDPQLYQSAGTVLLTNDALKAENATFYAKSGKRGPSLEQKKEVPTINENGSLLNRNVPGMTNMFKVLRESALKKTAANLKSSSSVIVEERGEMEKEIDPAEDNEDHGPPPAMEKLGGDLRNDVFDQWPLYSNRAIDFKEACELLIGVQQLEEDKLCKTLPLQFKLEGTFLIDLRSCRDVYNDDNGTWETPSGKTRFYKETSESGNLIRVDDGKGRLKAWTKDYTFKIVLKKYENAVTREADDGRGQFQRKVYTGLKNDIKLNVAIVTYSWSGGRPWNFVPPAGAASSRKAQKNTNWEKKSYENVDMTSMPQIASSYFEGFNIYSHCIINFDEASAILLGATVVDSNKLCSSVPLGYRQNGTFVIDLKRMGHCLLELRRDDNGLWTKPSGFSRFYKFIENGDAIRVDKAGKLAPGVSYDVKIFSKRYENTQVEKKFVRKIYTAKGPKTETFPGSPEFAVIVYYWKGEPIPFVPTYKQNMVRSDEKEFARYQQMAEEDQEFVETMEVEAAPVVMEEEVVGEEEQREIMDKNLQPPELKRARFAAEPSSSESNLIDMKMQLIRREMENQERFSAVLDRADALLVRMEQRFGMVYAVEDEEGAEPIQQWNHHHHHVVGEEEIIEEEVIQEY